jgi:hypothetical protein
MKYAEPIVLGILDDKQGFSCSALKDTPSTKRGRPTKMGPISIEGLDTEAKR